MGDNKIFRLSDSVSMRIIQIFQEALLMGLDGADLLRQVRVVPGTGDNSDTLVLDPDYEKRVQESFEKYLEEAKRLQEVDQTKLIIGG